MFTDLSIVIEDIDCVCLDLSDGGGKALLVLVSIAEETFAALRLHDNDKHGAGLLACGVTLSRVLFHATLDGRAASV